MLLLDVFGALTPVNLYGLFPRQSFPFGDF